MGMLEHARKAAVKIMPGTVVSWATQQYLFWNEGRRMADSLHAREQAFKLYRSCWHELTELEPIDQDEHLRAAQLQKMLDDLEMFITHGPGTEWARLVEQLRRDEHA